MSRYDLLISLATTSWLAAISLPCQAIDYSVGPSMRIEANHDSNLLLQESAQSASGYTSTASIDAGAASETTTVNVDVALTARRYEISGFDSDDQRAGAKIRHDRERSAVGLELNGVRDSTLTSELLDSGLVGNADRHQQLMGAPYLEYQVSELDLLTLQAAYIDSQYAESGYVDYTYWSSSVLWGHTLGERTSVLMQILYSDYESDTIAAFFDQSYSNRSTTWGIQLGGEYHFTEKLSLSLMGGRSENKAQPSINDPNNICVNAEERNLLDLFPLCTLEDSKSTLTTLDSSLSWRNVRNTLSAHVSRKTQPSSTGDMQISEQLDLEWQYQLFLHSSLSAKATIGSNEFSARNSAQGLNFSRDYLYGTLTYAHILNESWSIQCSYRYRAQQYEERDNIDSHVAMLAFVWQPQASHWSL